jgi:hypothetical protein
LNERVEKGRYTTDMDEKAKRKTTAQATNLTPGFQSLS